ncbi:MFS transporter [Limosilactobacillus mucosae]
MKTYRMQSLVLVLIAFALGFSEFIIVGVLPDIAKTFNEPVTVVGLLVTIFALAYAFSTPLITMMIGTRSLLKVETWLWLVFILGNVMVMAAPNYPILVAARVITAIVSGVIISIATTFANSLAPLEKRAGLIAWIFSGFSIASVFGVPVGTWISMHFGWRTTFGVIVAVSLVILFLMSGSLPIDLRQGKAQNFSDQFRIFGDRRIYVGMLLPMFNLAATYTFYTYLRPMLAGPLHFGTGAITMLLFIYGLMSLFSNQFSGWLVELGGLHKMPLVYLLQFIGLALLSISLNIRGLALILVMLIGVLMYLLNSPIQLHFIDIATHDYPASLVMASSINSIFSNFGIALGSATGSLLVKTHGLIAVGPGGAVYAAVAGILVIWLNRINQKMSPVDLK